MTRNRDSLGQMNYLKTGSCEAAVSSLKQQDPADRLTSAACDHSAAKRRRWTPVRQKRKGGVGAWTTDLRSLSPREKTCESSSNSFPANTGAANFVRSSTNIPVGRGMATGRGWCTPCLVLAGSACPACSSPVKSNLVAEIQRFKQLQSRRITC